jgi:MoCo/4Fe-4S cofactor protein with predicted Tat translocation signal
MAQAPATRTTSHMSDEQTIDLASVRGRLAASGGKQYWKSLDELADTPEFRALVQREFPAEAAEWFDPKGRRGFLKLMGASIALAGATACTRQPDELLVPYVRQPEEIVPGKPLFFATAMTLGGIATGLLAESHVGRPTKLEGNPEHPSSLGATDLFAQGSILTMYDPDRSRAITYLGEVRPWTSFAGAMQTVLGEIRAMGGTGLHFLTETITSPTLAAQLQGVLGLIPGAKWHQWDPVTPDGMHQGGQLAFGSPVHVHYKFDAAQVIVALDADLFGPGTPGNVRYARDFASGRRIRKANAEMNRLYVAEPTPTPTGAIADSRLPLKASQVDAVARAILAGVTGGTAASLGNEALDAFVRAAVQDLAAARGRGLVAVGARQPAEAHAVAHAINHALGNIGATVIVTDPFTPDAAGQIDGLKALASDLNAGAVRLLVILGSNPVYTAPADLKFAEALRKAQTRVHVGLFDDETAALCHWHVNSTHFLEEWSDARAHDGTASIVQPLIAPLYGGRSFHEVVAIFSDRPERTGYDLVREYWQAQPAFAGQTFDTAWRKAVHDGVIAGSAPTPKAIGAPAVPPAPTPVSGGVEVAFAADPTIYDGRFANNGWLQETPKPLTKLTWDNAVLMAPATAQRLGVGNGDYVTVAAGGRTVDGPTWIQPGHAPDAVTVYLGYGRTRAGRIGTGVGYDAYQIRVTNGPGFAGGEVRRTGESILLASTQGHHSMEGRAIVRAGTLEEYHHAPDFAQHMAHTPAREMTMYPEYEYTGYAWGMAIDQTVCTGCTACVVACVAENNIPIIGKEQVLRGREMHWLRVDRYFEGDPANPGIYHQPMLCQHCENAPCEVVCPVAATVHSDEGLNDMVYNRCVGTRYCSHNCPYKVRRFNFLLYSDWNTPSYKLQRNPDVTVRSRGVMEKCTYCVQRINEARQDAKVQDRKVRDGDIKTACQQACPTDAIVFGDINDPGSRVSQLKAEAHNYALLADLNTRPRTTYLAAIRNPNPALVSKTDGHHGPLIGVPEHVPPADVTESNSMTHREK